ncbi:PrsW family glutamic-type intramembrane protease [Sunxiuqinia sp. A32]|uniref:PrsW family glutamic-type intramembrane protease n=1 Tax=Sunxiuqinia sp. A32 TaxID=3461496 RepID=UPI0040467387
MTPNLIVLAFAPVVILLAYIWFRDKYEKEPFKMLFTALLFGAFSVIPILLVEEFFMEFLPLFSGTMQVFLHSFVVAALTEEFFKFVFLYLLIWKSPEFNEKFDGIVYAVYVSLGFAAVENVMYVFDYGMQVGFTRAITAVPAHFLFGVTMGYFVGLAKFYPERKKRLIRAALLFPILLHGVYDFILMMGHPFVLLIFIPFVVFMWIYGLKKMKTLSAQSIYRNDFTVEEDLLKKL